MKGIFESNSKVGSLHMIRVKYSRTINLVQLRIHTSNIIIKHKDGGKFLKLIPSVNLLTSQEDSVG